MKNLTATLTLFVMSVTVVPQISYAGSESKNLSENRVLRVINNSEADSLSNKTVIDLAKKPTSKKTRLRISADVTPLR